MSGFSENTFKVSPESIKVINGIKRAKVIV